MHARLLTVPLVIALVAGCEATRETDGLALCPDAVTITVGAGLTPTLSWRPACRISELIVDPNSDVVDSWVIRTVGDTNGLQPPIQYGRTPVGAVTLVGPIALQAATTYRVRVLRASGDTSSPFIVVGATFFQR